MAEEQKIKNKIRNSQRILKQPKKQRCKRQGLRLQVMKTQAQWLEKEEKLEKESEQMCLGWKWVCKGTNPCKELKKKKISEEKEMRFGS